MGCSSSQEECGSPRATSLLERRDSHGRVSIPLGKRRVDLNDQKMTRLPAFIGTEGLEVLSVTDNKLRELPSSFGGSQWASLTELILDNNVFESVPVVVSKLRSLQHLSLSGNRLEMYDTLKSLKKCSSLVKLTLCSCRLVAIPGPILDNPTITELNLSRNSGISLSGISKMQVAILNVSWCSLTTLPEELGSCQKLRVLSMSGNPVSLAALAALKPVKTLKSLTAQCMVWKKLPPELAGLRLTHLDVGKNYLDTFDALGDMKGLTDLDLSSNGLTKVPIEAASLGLTRICLNNNHLMSVGQLCGEEINKKTLETLEVCGNNFTRSVRAEQAVWRAVSKLQNLKSITFRDWGGGVKNVNPYSTKVPVPLLSIPLQHINGVAITPPATTCIWENLISVIKSSYFKPDFGFDFEARYKYHVNLLCYYHEHLDELTMSISKSLTRYKMFLHLQSISEAKLIAPLDVSLFHYIHMIHQEEYAADCTALFGDVIENCYHGVDRVSPLIDTHPRYVESRLAWAKLYGKVGYQAYDFPFNEGDDEEEDGNSVLYESLLPENMSKRNLSVDFEEILPIAAEHFAKVFAYRDVLTESYQSAVTRFYKFTALLSMKHFTEPDPYATALIPTTGIQLMLHIYTCLPGKVWNYLFNEKPVGHGLLPPHYDSPLQFAASVTHTKELWHRMFDEEYLAYPSPGDDMPEPSLSPSGISHLEFCRRKSSSHSSASYGSTYDPLARPSRSSIRNASILCCLEPGTTKRDSSQSTSLVRFADSTCL